jgi:UDP-N-acetylglucosamine--N-acetylmuramyl-(pentapeptide) pyrophosphoryl-undecaprenol N-acetylglucosamine transferase
VSADVVITGGGTGGHTSPGLAVAAALRDRGLQCVWIGSRDGIEARRAPACGIPYIAIPTGKLRRYWAWRNVTDLAVNVPAGIVEAHAALRRVRPRLVFATGGFVALPVALAAAVLRRPLIIHEQTSVPGLANRIAARLARRVAITFADSARCFRADKVVLTGNPLRPELRHGTRQDAVTRFGLDATLPLVYVTGGALGARAINRAVGQVLAPLLQHAQVIHQCGDNAATGDHQWLQKRRAELPPALAARYTVVPYIGQELAGIYAAASLMVARAGAGTVNEACQLGVPALYIPLPGTSGDEQTANARLVGRAGGCSILPQATMTPALLLERIQSLLGDPTRLKEMAERARTVAIADADTRIADLIEEVIRAGAGGH